MGVKSYHNNVWAMWCCIAYMVRSFAIFYAMLLCVLKPRGREYNVSVFMGEKLRDYKAPIEVVFA